MDQRRLRPGDYLWRRGEPADAVFRIRAGSVRLGPETVAAGPGEPALIGGIELITGAARATAAVAADEVVADVLTRAEFMAALTDSSDLAGPFFAAIAARIAVPEAPAVEPEPEPEPAAPTIRIRPEGRRASGQLPEHGIVPPSLPFRIGRVGSEGKEYPDVNLLLRDSKPYSLSRRHFEVAVEGAAVVVRDCGSYHGTIVNGKLIGAGTGQRSIMLGAGVNQVIAGPQDSPFRFAVLVGEG